MKICIIGHFSGDIQEGVRNVSRDIADRLQNEGNEVKKFDTSILLPLREIRKFQPEIIHFILTPTIRGLIFAKVTSFFYPKAKVIISAIHPSISRLFFLRYLQPDLILVQSTESESLFKSLGYKTSFLPNGIDIEKFRPFDKNLKKEIRKKMKISTDEFIILHMASLTKERNLSVLAKIQRQGDCKVLIIGRENEKFDSNVTHELGSSGCNILIKNFENIEEIYNMADCYVFPTINKKACIEMPLSVLEAMACNLPIITTRFGALPRLFNEGGGLFYIDNEREITRYIELIRNRNIIINTRQKVLSVSWSCIVKNLCEYYDKLLQ